MSQRKIKQRGCAWSPSPDVRTYCDLLVYLWPGYRRAMEAAGTYPATVYDQIEQNSIAVFREIRDEISRAVESDRSDDADLKLPGELGKRYILAALFSGNVSTRQAPPNIARRSIQNSAGGGRAMQRGRKPRSPISSWPFLTASGAATEGATNDISTSGGEDRAGCAALAGIASPRTRGETAGAQ